ncbi:hypothetical protein OH802_21345 [Nocardioides sp. NBC_00850]|uniref:helix-turn-helix domain-containing protein n=1 Tax=Nocardioides sp. NBC_00850 TaxID=2976001 RepID=UPI0038707295|nr:hypothetical protein OH802_21345 [Nocardioides sp. NBC_00850]
MFGRRNARAAARWMRFAERAASDGLTIVRVLDVCQVARTGTKAVVTIYDDHRARDAWFWWDRVEAGSTLAVVFSSGYGPHSLRDGVIFVGNQTTGSGVHDRLSGPKWIVQRFRVLEVAARAHSGEVDWAAVAAELDFSDQAHLVRTFRDVVGAPPATYAKDLWPRVSPSSASADGEPGSAR